ncbi:ExeA family protein [Thermoproteota archaeon]
MYEKFYNFKEKPFSVTPDTKYFYASEKHEEALSSLLYAIQERRGFVVITGEIGSGKTTSWRVLINRLDRTTKIALILNTHLTPKQMLMAILEEFEVSFKDTWTKVKMLSMLNRFLLEQISMGINVVLIIDEAQNLTKSTLEEVRMLSNLETEKEKLIQIILMGQPELREKLACKSLEQLRQRIQVSYHLLPLSRDETRSYIEYRLRVAGIQSGMLFSKNTFDKIYEYTGGVPRLINTLCDRALLNGFVQEKAQIDEDIIEESAMEIEGVRKEIMRESSNSEDSNIQEILKRVYGKFSKEPIKVDSK